MYDLTSSFDVGFNLAGGLISLSGLMLFAVPLVQERVARQSKSSPPPYVIVSVEEQLFSPVLGCELSDSESRKPLLELNSKDQEGDKEAGEGDKAGQGSQESETPPEDIFASHEYTDTVRTVIAAPSSLPLSSILAPHDEPSTPAPE